MLEVFFVGSALATAWVFMKDTRSRRTLIFLVIWFGLSLLPVYKLFNIWDDLRGSPLGLFSFRSSLRIHRIWVGSNRQKPIDRTTCSNVLMYLSNFGRLYPFH